MAIWTKHRELVGCIFPTDENRDLMISFGGGPAKRIRKPVVFALGSEYDVYGFGRSPAKRIYEPCVFEPRSGYYVFGLTGIRPSDGVNNRVISPRRIAKRDKIYSSDGKVLLYVSR